MIARILMTLCVIFVFALSPMPAAHACETGLILGGAIKAGSCGGSLAWRFDQQRNAFVKGGIPDGGKGAPHYYYANFTRCEAGVDCMAAHTCDASGLRFNVEAWLLGPDGSRASVTPIRDTVCGYPERVVPAGEVSALAHEEIRKRITAPTLTSAPPGKTLVNIITVYSTNRQPEPRIDVTTPVPGSIVAVPEYRWDFGDGQTALGPGLQWSAPDDPNKLPGKYLGPVWRTSGIKHVTLTVTWRVRFQLEGVIDVPLEPIVFTATEDKQVMTARAVLVNQ